MIKSTKKQNEIFGEELMIYYQATQAVISKYANSEDETELAIVEDLKKEIDNMFKISSSFKYFIKGE